MCYAHTTTAFKRTIFRSDESWHNTRPHLSLQGWSIFRKLEDHKSLLIEMYTEKALEQENQSQIDIGQFDSTPTKTGMPLFLSLNYL